MFNKTKKNELLKELNKMIFWDVDFKDVDYKNNVNFIIERVLSYGDEKDFRRLKKIYGLKKIKKIAVKLDYPNKKVINFWSLIFDISIDSFLCIKKLSMPKPNVFWRR